jgi:hypothetical protein
VYVPAASVDPSVCEPLGTAFEPVHGATAVQEVGLFDAFQATVVLLPAEIVLGVKVNVVTTGTATTLTVTDLVPEPILFKQVSVKVTVPAVLNGPTVTLLPVIDCGPVQTLPVLLAVHVAGLLITLHVKFVVPPTPIVAALEVNVWTTGATVAVPEFIETVVDAVTVLPALFWQVVV